MRCLVLHSYSIALAADKWGSSDHERHLPPCNPCLIPIVGEADEPTPHSRHGGFLSSFISVTCHMGRGTYGRNT